MIKISVSPTWWLSLWVTVRVQLFADEAGLQYDGVVKADVCERPVNYHHVCVKDLSSQLQQAEHGASVEFYRRNEKREKNAFILQRLIKTQGYSWKCWESRSAPAHALPCLWHTDTEYPYWLF